MTRGVFCYETTGNSLFIYFCGSNHEVTQTEQEETRTSKTRN